MGGGVILPFTFEKTDLEGPMLVKPRVFSDERGFFMETFAQRDFEAAGISGKLVQINHSRSVHGVLRGLHFQRSPYAQAKLVRCIRGEIRDVAVDMRLDSGSLGKNVTADLSESNRHMLFVPRGFAHGFIVLSDVAEVEYAVDNIYAPDHEGGIIWNDPDLAIAWPIENPILSEKDKRWPRLRDIKEPL